MADKIRLGIIGANIHRGWAVRSHLPAVVASPEFELTAVCTTRMESAEESRRMFGARLAFDDYHAMLAHPDIDAVAVSLRVPNHYDPTVAAINAGKHVYVEWPLGRTTAEAQEMADLARAKGVRNMVGLQARANPALLYLRDLVAEGYVGEVMSCHVRRISGGSLSRQSDRTWQRDRELGAHTLTITFGHTIDVLRMVVGDFSHVSTVVSTQANQWFETDTNQMVDVTSPDNVLVSGRLVNGAVASAHVASNPWVDSGYLMEIHGREGTLVATLRRHAEPRGRATAGFPGQQPAGGSASPGEIHLRAGGNAPRRAVLRRPDVLPVRRGHPQRNGLPARFRRSGTAAPLHRRHPGGVGHRAGSDHQVSAPAAVITAQTVRMRQGLTRTHFRKSSESG